MEEKPKREFGSPRDFLGREDEDVEEKGGAEKEKEVFNPTPHLLLILFVFLLALGARLAVLFFYTDPQNPGLNWYGDVWHHWQIAYLSWKVGFQHGFLRLWDFKGLEYYWGLLHPLALIAGFIISGSISILVPRMVSVIFSSLAITLIFLIVARYFNKKAAFASALFLTFMPVALFSDTLGMQEPLGLFFLVLGLYLWPRWAALGGVSWMLAGMVRSEYWLFSFGLLLAVLIREKNFDKKIATLFGYGVPALLYMKYMLDYTGNPIYPIYWNFLASVAGEWFVKEGVQLSEKVQIIKMASQALTLGFLGSGLLVFWRKPRGYLFYLLGLANLAFILFIFGFGAYLYGYLNAPLGFIDRFWVDRLLAWPYGFLGVLLAIVLLYFLPRKIGKLGTLSGSLVFLVLLALTQLSWPSINYHYTQARGPLGGEEELAKAIAEKYTWEGSVLIPGGRPALTYYLVYQEKIPGDKLISEFYDPFYYYQGEDPFAEWDEFRREIVDWLEKHNAELFVVGGDFSLSETLGNYGKMFEIEEGKLFELVGEGGGYKIFKVKINGN